MSLPFRRARSGGFYNQGALQPHRSRYWLNAKTKTVDPLAFAQQVETICTLYAYAPLLHALGGHIVSCDEMTGIHALERIATTQPMRSGRPERRELEYLRHGTLSPIVNFDIVTGQVIAPASARPAPKPISSPISPAPSTAILKRCGGV